MRIIEISSEMMTLRQRVPAPWVALIVLGCIGFSASVVFFAWKVPVTIWGAWTQGQVPHDASLILVSLAMGLFVLFLVVLLIPGLVIVCRTFLGKLTVEFDLAQGLVTWRHTLLWMTLKDQQFPLESRPDDIALQNGRGPCGRRSFEVVARWKGREVPLSSRLTREAATRDAESGALFFGVSVMDETGKA